LEKAPEAFRIISEVADDLDVPQHVLRFWESRFTQIRPMKRGGGRRYYRPDDVDLLRGIRHLLYSEGYTIRGVQRILREQSVQFVQSVWREGAPQPPRMAAADDTGEEAERGRGLLNLIPGFRKPSDGTDADAAEADDEADQDQEEADTEDEETPERREPVFAERASAAPQARGLSRDQLLQLQMALDGLGECRRLLDAALKEA
jgi:DNA-binding transcriptional MerR regulator